MHGTKAEHQLKGRLLVLCLLDMIKVFAINEYRVGIFYRYLKHPLIKNKEEINKGRVYYLERFLSIDDMINRLETESPTKMVEEFNLLNSNAFP